MGVNIKLKTKLAYLIIKKEINLVEFEATVYDISILSEKKTFRHLIQHMLVSPLISNKILVFSKISVGSYGLHLCTDNPSSHNPQKQETRGR